MKNKKIVLIVIIILLIIFIPLTVTSYILNLNKDENINPNHDFIKDGYLWFYDNNDNLINKYKCQNTYCDLASFTIDDEDYGLNYYSDGTINKMEYKSSSHTLISDGTDIYLYDVLNNQTILTLKNVKTYNTDLDGNYIIQNKSNDLWGVIKITQTGANDFASVIPVNYEFIGIKNSLDSLEKLSTEMFIVKKNDKWYVVDKNNEIVSPQFDKPIIDYSENHYIVKNASNYDIYDKNNNLLNKNHNVSKYYLLNNYVGFIIENGLYVYDDVKLLSKYDLPNPNSVVELTEDGNNIKVKIDGIEQNAVAIN